MTIWQILSLFGDTRIWLLATIFAIILYWVMKKKRKYTGFFLKKIFPSVFLARFFVEILKQTFRIPRPCVGLEYCPSDFSFPSGHAGVIFAVATMLILKKKDERFNAFFLIFASLVDLSRLMLRVHRIEDVIVGSIIGIISAVLVQKIYKKWGSRDLNPGHRLPKPGS